MSFFPHVCVKGLVRRQIAWTQIALRGFLRWCDQPVQKATINANGSPVNATDASAQANPIQFFYPGLSQI